MWKHAIRWKSLDNPARHRRSQRPLLRFEPLEARRLMAINSSGLPWNDGGPIVAPEPTETCADHAPVATFDWSMYTRFGSDSDRDGRTDIPNTRDYVLEEEFGVIFVSDPTFGNSFHCGIHQWQIEGPQLAEPIAASTDKDFFFRAELPQGSYTVTHTVSPEPGQPGSTTTATQDIEVRDLLIVSIGDSVASGEGNPEVRQRFNSGWSKIVDTWVTKGAQWADSPFGKKSHRSSAAAPAQAALGLEQSDPHTSVTFVSVAASGATIENGLLGGYKGRHGSSEMPSQIDQIRELTCPTLDSPPEDCRPIDALMISVGANDIGFSDIVKTLVLSPVQALNHTAVEEAIGNLTRPASENEFGYDALNRRVRETLNVDPSGVYITEYFDPATDQTGQTCRKMLREFDRLLPGFVVTREEAQWARDNVVAPLNEAVRTAAESHGWNYVGGIADAFVGHGYCASNGDRWIRTAGEARRMQGPYTPTSWALDLLDKINSLAADFTDLVDDYVLPGWADGLIHDTIEAIDSLSYSELARLHDLSGTKGTLHPNEEGHAAIADILLERFAFDDRGRAQDGIFDWSRLDRAVVWDAPFENPFSRERTAAREQALLDYLSEDSAEPRLPEVRPLSGDTAPARDRSASPKPQTSVQLEIGGLEELRTASTHILPYLEQDNVFRRIR